MIPSEKKEGSPKESLRSAMRVVAVLGDVHGDWDAVLNACEQARAKGAVALVQVGDLGWSARLLAKVEAAPACLPVYAIEGNHEDFGFLGDLSRTRTMAPSLSFVGRGDVRNIGGWRIGFLGGAESVDKAYRKTRFSASTVSGEYLWWEEERVGAGDADRLISNARDGIDLLVTHSPPDCTIRQHFPPEGLRMFGLDPAKWTDPSALRVEACWKHLGCPPLICGHMHRAVTDGPVRILDINELTLVAATTISEPTAPSPESPRNQ